MVRTIPHRELRNNSSKILEEVRNGETIHITNHGVVVATLIPPQDDRPSLHIEPARHPVGWKNFDIPPASPDSVPISEEYWDDVRRERL